MLKVAVVAHAGKSFGGGLGELREVLARDGFADPLWYEVKKSRKAPRYARRALVCVPAKAAGGPSGAVA